jgi:hypothetical protein
LFAIGAESQGLRCMGVAFQDLDLAGVNDFLARRLAGREPAARQGHQASKPKVSHNHGVSLPEL